MTMVALAEGTLFAGRYRIRQCIAQGGMGAVYQAMHLETERRCALKVMLPDLVQSQEMRDRFRQEAKVGAQVQSEFIVDVLDAGIDEVTRMPFMVMELLEGEELQKRLKRLGRLEPQDVVIYLHQAALALDKTHKANIVHRDLKPANLFLTEREDGSPRIKLLDFGIAKLVAEGATNAAATRSLGTPLYMAPEQFQMGQKITPATDIYALGMMAFTMLVGTSYWHEEASAGANVFAFAALAMTGPKEPASARAMRRGVRLPDAFDAWFARVTAMSPSARFSTASAAVLALTEALGVSPMAQRTSSVLPTEPTRAPATTTDVPAQTSAGTTLVMARSSKAPHTSKGLQMLLGIVIGVAVVGTGSFLAMRPGDGTSAAALNEPPPTQTAIAQENPPRLAPSEATERPPLSDAQELQVAPSPAPLGSSSGADVGASAGSAGPVNSGSIPPRAAVSTALKAASSSAPRSIVVPKGTAAPSTPKPQTYTRE